jgi:UDP-3-O-[3-hydroxymyristoyl] N-acetylglucosamine deacetylase
MFGGEMVDSAMAQQKTLKAAIHCRGIGLHSGSRVGMTLHPAAPDSGIVFRRADRGGAEVAARWTNVVDTSLCTTIGNREGVTVGTIEHLMAALAGLEVDNCLVELDGPEVPVMDGSASPFVFLIECAGIAEQDAPRRAVKILKPVTVGDGRKSATLSPDQGFTVSFEIDFDSRAIKRQEIGIAFEDGTFRTEVSRARTFGFLHEVEGMRAAGLARGGSLDNAVVIDGDRIMNEDGLRYADEFVRHKVLDAVGDLYLAGAPLIGHFHGVRSGHALNRQILEALFADPSAWCWTTQTRGHAAALDERAASPAGAWEQPARARA